MAIKLPELFDDARNESAYDAMQQRYAADASFEQQQDIFIQQRGDAGLVGKIEKINASSSNAARDAQAREEAKKRSDAMDRATLLNLLDDRIAGYDARLIEIDNRITEIDARIVEIDAETAELEELEDLIENGDPNDPRRAALMDKYGITEGDIRSGEANAKIDQAKKDRADEKGELSKERTDLKREEQDVRSKRDRDADIRRRVKSGDMTIEEAQESIPDLKATVDGREQLAEIAITSTDADLTEVVTTAGDTEGGKVMFSEAAMNADDLFGADDDFSFGGTPSAARELDDFSLNAPDVAQEFRVASADRSNVQDLTLDRDAKPEALDALNR